MKVYYAHSLHIYNTPREDMEIFDIRTKFPNAEILDPNRIISETSISSQVMKKCIRLVRQCDVVVFSEYGGHIGLGVYREIQCALSRRIKVYLLRGGEFRKIKEQPEVVNKGLNWRTFARVKD